MRFAIDVPNFARYSDARLLAELAHESEDAGWDGFFIWDHIQVGWPDAVVDPWIALAAIACATKRIRIGALVTPLFRRAPWKVARESVTLDHLSGGRLVLGAGLGTDLFKEISVFDGPTDDRVRAEMLDESLAILTGLWSGEPFSFAGKHYRMSETCFMPAPVQSPRIPIWLAGTWPRKRPFVRAARHEGVVPIGGSLEKPLGPEDMRAIASFIKANRTSAEPFDIVSAGETPANDAALAQSIAGAYAEAGATWWLEATLPWKQSFEDFRARIHQGPPR